MTAQIAFAQSEAAGVALHWCPLDTDETIALTTAETLLSPTEAARAGSFHFARDRDRFVRGRGFLRRVLARSTGVAPHNLPIRAGAQGKPLLDLPGAPGFNLSHAGGLAVLALRSDGGPVGIDLERHDRALDPDALLDTCFSKAEAQAMRVLPLARRKFAFLACWTAKEAVMKLTGAGMTLDPRAIVLELQDGLPRSTHTPAARLVSFPVARHVCHIALPISA